ncbi:hypothetical protein GGF38_004062, partial [Coemansia sp. RSA 25]
MFTRLSIAPKGLARVAVRGMGTSSAAAAKGKDQSGGGGKVNESSTAAMEFKQQHPRQLRRLPRVDVGPSAAEQA